MNVAGLSNTSVRALRGLVNGGILTALRRLAASTAFLWSVLALGVAVRAVRYLANRSLWGDEGALALNLVHKSSRELLEPLEYMQGAPTGFLLIEKAAVGLLGDEELVLRLFPFVCGLLSLFLFAAVARRLLAPEATAIALLLFATVEPLVYYSSEVKQYSTDVAAALLLLYAVVVVDWDRISRKVALLLAIGGAAVAWLSHPALIVLATLAAAVLIASWAERRRTAIRSVLLIGSVWAGSALGSYLVNSSNARSVSSAVLQSSPESGFAPVELLDAVWDGFAQPVGVARTTTALALVATVAGVFALAGRNTRHALFVAAPIAGTLMAALLGLYAFSDRFILFLVPFVLLFLAQGLWAIVEVTSVRLPVVALMIGGLLLAYPLATAAKNVISPPGHEEVRTVLGHIDARWRPGDALYVWYQSQYPFRYYAECADCDALTANGVARTVWPPDPDDARGTSALVSHPPALIVGERSHALSSYLRDFDRLPNNRRVWLLFSSTWDDRFVQQTLDCLGERLDEAHDVRAAAYLYDLRETETEVENC